MPSIIWILPNPGSGRETCERETRLDWRFPTLESSQSWQAKSWFWRIKWSWETNGEEQSHRPVCSFFGAGSNFKIKKIVNSDQARADFGDYEFPVFVETTEKTVENEQHYAYQWKLWLKLRRELNELRKEQNAKKSTKKIVTKLTAERRLSERQKFGFIPGSEKMDKTAYFIFMEKTRAQFKDK